MHFERTIKWLLLLALALLLDWSLPAFAYRLPDSGQTKCYSITGSELVPCPAPGESYYGQDGNYRGHQMNYQDNGDGTVTDLNTGLMWEKGDSQNQYTRIWREADNYCKYYCHLGLHKDWRLPAQAELLTLVHFGRTNPAINTTYFPGCYGERYWSATQSQQHPDSKWQVQFNGGFSVGANESLSSCVRCVRGGP